ncbi:MULTISPECIES: hypothetical protein [Rhodococcus]|uniref:hypothetical protein n=1 Tax=Rhodococcus TaxID=1827 RepID=UPI0020A3F575|nr:MULTISPECIES: hypothetical protein [Rhodococcus]MEA1798883.1 hypothetical protein [Rhodococcus qingshengii]
MKFSKVTKAVRLTLGSSAPADADDPLGRDYVGYSQELAPEELWERARGVWKLRADHVAASSIALVVFDRRVVLVASISGIAFHRGALSIVGAPISGHALIGHPDPLHTADPLAHGVFGLGQVGNGIDVISSRWVVEREPPTTAYSLRHEGKNMFAEQSGSGDRAGDGHDRAFGGAASLPVPNPGLVVLHRAQ